MENSELISDSERLVAQLNAGAHNDLVRPVLREILSRQTEDSAPSSSRLESVEALGHAMLDQAISPSEAVRCLLTAARNLVDTGEASGRIDHAGARRLMALADEAVVQLLAAMATLAAGRRQAWLGFLVHELKNPLNTLLNSLWLLREKGSDRAQATRFIEIGERAIRKLDARIQDVRELDEQLVKAPPGWRERQSSEVNP